MANDTLRITLPVGRLVQGSVYEGRDKDADGNPLLIKNGPNQGKPRVDFYMAIAIPKEPGHTHWAHTAWGQQIYAAGAQAFPNAYQSPAFAWKIEDGDSQIPNSRGRKPCDNDGWAGHWILKLGGGYAPRVYQQTAPGTYVQLPENDRSVKLGYYVQAQIAVEGNGSSQRPGLYLNHGMVLFAAAGQEIVVGPDAAQVFGTAPVALPPGAIPVAANPAMPGAMPAMPTTAAPQMPAMPTAAVPAMPAMPTTAAPPPVAVQPHPGFMAPVVAAPAVPVMPPAPVRQMTAKAQGIPLADWLAKGWTEAALVSEGYMA